MVGLRFFSLYVLISTLILIVTAFNSTANHNGHHTLYQHCRSPPKDACSENRKIMVEGGWCLEPHRDGSKIAPGRPLAEAHVHADDGIAKAMATIIPDNVTVIDIGAGIGQYQVWFMNNGKKFKRYLAYDGAANVEEFTWGSVRYLNVAHKVIWYPHEISDWVISLEVGEHIGKEYETTFIHNLHHVNRHGMILSWAIPNQGGNGHVNEQPNDYIISTLAKLGYDYDKESSDMGRKQASYFWFRKSFMVFRKRVPLIDQ